MEKGLCFLYGRVPFSVRRRKTFFQNPQETFRRFRTVGQREGESDDINDANTDTGQHKGHSAEGTVGDSGNTACTVFDVIHLDEKFCRAEGHIGNAAAEFFEGL